MTKEEAAKLAQENWEFAHRCDREGKPEFASEARARAIEYEKERDSWFYRTFGW